MTLFRRFCLVQLLMVWQGGFLFYTSFVVPVGTTVLGSARAQGVITARVTDTLNVLGVLGLAAMAWELNYSRDRSTRRTTARWWCWGVMLVCQWLLFFTHQLLDAFMDTERTRVIIRPLFYPTHRVYLWTITVQWFTCLILAALTLAAWRAEDRKKKPNG
ncbi:MAG: hypothetical protein C0467_08650 [Planctomycetaceae bacterium]|nr:hypothetical protein [Planctomycetaceae bacterium]